MPVITSVTQAVDRAWEREEKGPRPHLGASVVGKPCERAMVYGFRHASVKKTEGRMLRLFNRGHREEPSINASLVKIGFEVRPFAQRLTWHDASSSYAALEWDESEQDYLDQHQLVDVTLEDHHVVCAEHAGVKLKQWAFHDIGGHHSGSTDGKARNPSANLFQVPELPPDEWFGLEFKTSGTKPWLELVAAGSVRDKKPEHYSQMQEYMHYMELPRCLYICVNKNTDEWYVEVVAYDRPTALAAIEKATRGVCATRLPRRYSDNPTNFVCRYCDHKMPCHFGEPLVKSCRTCRHVTAVPTGDESRWHCSRWASLIPPDAVKAGCDQWSELTD